VPDDELTITEFSGLQTLYTSFYVDMVSVVPLSPIFELGPDTALCYGEPLLIDATMPCNAVYTWENGSAYPLRNITQPGIYSINIQLGCSVISDEIRVSWYPEPMLPLPTDTVICPDGSVLLDAGEGYDHYLWQDGTTQPSLLADQVGIYWVEVTDGKGCTIRDTVNISALGPPAVDLGEDRNLCFGDSIVLNAGNDNIYSKYLWNDNSTWRFLAVNQDGTYRVEVSNPCDTRSDEIEIKFRSCIPLLTVPNAFTPNQDGLNDFFLASGVNISYFRMQVFNRWGELLFETNDLSEGWDGRKNGINCPSDIYVWLAYYESEALDIPVRETLKGNVVLLR
jgi:gliding motility-associated-like protein